MILKWDEGGKFRKIKNWEKIKLFLNWEPKLHFV